MKNWLALIPIALALSASLLLAGCVTTTPPHSADEIPPPSQSSDEIPPAFHGSWTYDASGVHPSRVELPWTVKAKSISGHESYGEVNSVNMIAHDEVVVSTDVSAEGEEFKATQTLKLSPDKNQLTLTSSGGGPLTLYRVR